ncbi:MAG: DUF2125 domain-containing protein [Cohaesibacteraceae bacterium]
MTDSAPSPRQGMSFARKIQILAGVVVLVLALATGAGVAGAAVYQAALDEGRRGLAAEGVTLACDGEELGGFPARFEWRCDRLGLTFANGARLEGEALTTVAMVWNPFFTIAEWQGPFAGQSADGFATSVDSALLRASVRLTGGLSDGMRVQRLSAVLDPFGVRVDGAQQPIATGRQAEFHLREPVAADGSVDPADLQAALVLLGLESLFLGGVDQIDMSITGLIDELAAVRARSLGGALRDWVGRSGTVEGLETRLRLDAHAINLDGDLQLATDGALTFDGAIATNDVPALVELMGFDAGGSASAITAGASFFGRQTTIGEDPATELPLVVQRGRVQIGPVPLGQLPPIRF